LSLVTKKVVPRQTARASCLYPHRQNTGNIGLTGKTIYLSIALKKIRGLVQK